MTAAYPALRKMQKELLGLVYSPRFSGPLKKSALHAIPIERIELYRDVTIYILQEAMEWIFPVTYQVTESQNGAKAWTRLVEKYVTRFQPKHYSLISSVSKFPEIFRRGSWQGELAAYELAHAQLRNAIGSHQHGAEPKWMNPNLRLMSFRFSISDFHKKCSQLSSDSLFLEKPTRSKKGVEFVAVFYCSFREKVRTLTLHPIAFSVLTLCQGGVSLDQAVTRVVRKIKAGPSFKAEVVAQLSRLFDQLTEEKALSANPLVQRAGFQSDIS